MNNSAATSPIPKRPYRKGESLSGAEKQRKFVLRKKETHIAINVFIQKELKAELVTLCEKTGLTQTEMIESWILQERAR